jgi:hypothetical protein
VLSVLYCERVGFKKFVSWIEPFDLACLLGDKDKNQTKHTLLSCGAYLYEAYR